MSILTLHSSFLDETEKAKECGAFKEKYRTSSYRIVLKVKLANNYYGPSV